MKKYFFLIILLLPIISAVNDSAITGEAVSQEIKIDIFIGGLPYLEIITQEGTYLSEEILLDFISKNADEIIYNIDELENISINSSTSIILKKNHQTINIYAINSNGITKKSIDIEIDKNALRIIYNKFNKQKDKTTNFYKKTYENLLDLENLIIDNSEIGRIQFIEKVNLIDDKNPKDKTIDLDSNIAIEKEKIYLNETELPNLNKKAIIYFYNITYKNPILLKNKKPCPENTCKLIAYSNNIYISQVENFSEYSLIESTTSPPSTGSRQSSSKSENIPYSQKNFEINENRIILNLKEKHIEEKTILIINKETTEVAITLNQTGLEEIFSIKEKEIILSPNEVYPLNLEFIAKPNIPPGIYLGEIKLNSDTTTEEIWIVIEIESEQELFDAYIKILNENKEFTDRSILTIKSEIFNLGEAEEIDATIEYIIIDENKKEVTKRTKTVAVRTKIELIEDFYIDEKFKPGKYIILMNVNYNDKLAIASESFEIKLPFYKNPNFYFTIIFLLSCIIIILYKRNHISKKSKSRGK